MKTIFIGPNGIRAGWRLLMFFAILAVEVAIVGTIVHFAFPQAAAMAQRARPKTLQPVQGGAAEAIFLVFLVIAALIMSRIEKRPFADYGMPVRFAFGGRFWRGALWGFVTISAVLAVMAALHGFHVTGLGMTPAQIPLSLVLWTVAAIFIGLSEEFAFRGYSQYTLASGIGFWPAAIVLSLAFGAAHRGNPGESIFGLIEVVIFGLVFCLVLARTGNLWWGIGFHASWDWGESFFYGVRDSGMLPWHPLLASTSTGPVWLTGGTAGPEGSALTCVALGIVALGVAMRYPRVRYYSTGATSTT